MGGKEDALSPLLALGGPFKCGFFFLVRLAWDSHTRIPILIAIIFMVCDIRMQLEIDIETAVRRLPRQVETDEEDDQEDESDSEEETDDGSVSSSEGSVERHRGIPRQQGVMQDLNLCAAGIEPMPNSSSDFMLSD